MRRWIEVADECFGPDKKKGFWQMFLVIKRCCSYIAKKKSGPVEVIRRQNGVLKLTDKRKKGVVRQLQDFIDRKDVILLEAKK